MASLSHEKDEKPACSERYPIGSGDKRDEMSLANRQTKATVVSGRSTYMVRN